MTFDELVQHVSTHDTSICIDSRAVQKGDVFVAVKGNAADGHLFITDAIQRGARYIVYERQSPVDIHGMEAIAVDNGHRAAALLAQAALGRPCSQLVNLAVTGTNGKTTVAFLVHHCLRGAGQSCGLISTIAYDTGQTRTLASLTTPDCITIARMQARMVRAGCRFMITEASSHALSQDRLAGIDFCAAAFTNLSGDHLDYHHTEQAYLEAKTLLFAGLTGHATAVLNQQSPHARTIARQTPAHILWYAIDEQADLQAHILSMNAQGTLYDLYYQDQHLQVRSALLGRFNVSNHLAAAGLCLGAGLDLHTIARGLESLVVVPGRLERMDGPDDVTILIDFAHTDDALHHVLATLRPLCRGRLITVFGCGGDRDRTKRPRMAVAVQTYSDKVFLTSDNPRTEPPQQIMDDILRGFSSDKRPQVTIEPDRRRAIGLALEQARPGDIILIAGKGHESYQIIGNRRYPFSDKDVVQDILQTASRPL